MKVLLQRDYIEGSGRLVEADRVELIEPFVVRRGREPLPRSENRDIRNAFAALAQPVPAKGILRLDGKEVANHLRPMRTCERDQGRACLDVRVRVVDGDRAACGECVGNQLLLTTLRARVVAQEVFADMIVRAGKSLAVEGCLPRCRQPDQDDAFHC